MVKVYNNVYALADISHFIMATLIGSSGAGDDLIRKLHEMGVSRSCTTIKDVMERRDAIDQVIALERERQERLLEKERRTLRSGMRKRALLDSLLFFNKNKKSREYVKRIDHLDKNKDAIIENNLLYLYREKDVLDRVTREYRSELKGYYGELLVMDTLERLGDEYYVLSDVRITREFGHKFDGKMLKSARVDHVVVSRKGVYCIETKNWNLRWKSEDRPTPGEQARRPLICLQVPEVHVRYPANKGDEHRALHEQYHQGQGGLRPVPAVRGLSRIPRAGRRSCQTTSRPGP